MILKMLLVILLMSLLCCCRFEVCSKRGFDARIKQWRIALHNWDSPPDEAEQEHEQKGEADVTNFAEMYLLLFLSFTRVDPSRTDSHPTYMYLHTHLCTQSHNIKHPSAAQHTHTHENKEEIWEFWRVQKCFLLSFFRG